MEEHELTKVADFFRLAHYITNKDGQFIECDKNARKIFGIPENANDLSQYSISNMYEIEAQRNLRIEQVLSNPERPFSDAISIYTGEESKLLFDILWTEDGEELHGLAREMEESNLLSSYRAIRKMPTGFYYVEYYEDEEGKQKERVTHCNKMFLKILGLKDKNQIIGKSLKGIMRTTPEVYNNFFEELHKKAESDKPLLNHKFETQRFDDGEIIILTIDAHLIRDKKGNVLGREGTIRDASTEVKAEKSVKKATTDINNFIHTFLHPVVKFSGYTELLQEIATLLRPKEETSGHYNKEFGRNLLNQLKALEERLKRALSAVPPDDQNEENKHYLHLNQLTENIRTITNIFSYSLDKEKNKLLLIHRIKDTALWIFEEFQRAEVFQNSILKKIIGKNIFDSLRPMLFDHLSNGILTLKAESEAMRRQVESLRSFIGLKKERGRSHSKVNLGNLLALNVERFRPLFKDKGMEIEFKQKGNLDAEISKNDIERAVCNLFLNARKYSIFGTSRFISVEVREMPGGIVEFSIENLGYPIKKDEIESGFIFEFGNRGEFAILNDRDGTGVGLADVRDTVKAHGGELFLTSKPSRDDGDPPKYKVPYKTTVIIRLPKRENHDRQYN